MSDEKRVTIEDVGGDFGFRLKWSCSETWADFEAFEIVSREGDEYKTPGFHAKDWQRCDEIVNDISKAQASVEGYIKWDGCSHIELNESHLCGAESFKKHIALMRYLYFRASELMGRGKDGLDEPWGVSEKFFESSTIISQ